MADVSTQLSLAAFTLPNVVKGFYGKFNRMLALHEHPVEVFTHVTDGTPDTDSEIQTSQIAAVKGGIIYNITDLAEVTGVVVKPKAAADTIAVLEGTLTASKTYLVLIIGQKLV
jgi:hypothetical protein